MVESLSQFIPDDKVREIRETCSIVEVISDYVSLKKVGINYKGLCPFHNEKTPSFFVNENKKIFHCFGCGLSGDVFTFLMKHDNLSFVETTRLLAKRFGIYLPEKPLSPQQQRQRSERDTYVHINEIAAQFYNKLLAQDPRGETARKYLDKRGISSDTIRDYNLGYAPEGWNALGNYLSKARIPLAAAQKIGLIISKDNGQYYDRFRNRIMFPIINAARQVIGFGGRVFNDGEPKYLNSPESVIYNKRNNVYGLPAAVHAIQKENRAIIVEGYIDLLMLHQEGIKNAVAALGTALTEQQIQLLKRYTTNIITVFDADPSGEKAMIRSLEPFLKGSVSPRLVVLPQGEDPDSFVRRYGAQAFRDKIEGAGVLLDFVVESIIKKHDVSTPRGKVNACDEIVPLLEMISDTMERDLYIQKVSQRLSINEAHIRTRGHSGGQTHQASPNAGGSAAQALSDFRKNAELLVVKLMVSHPETIDIISRESLLEEFSDPDLKKLGMIIETTRKETGDVYLPSIMNGMKEDRLKSILAEMSFQNDALENPIKTLEDCIRNIRLQKIGMERKKINLLLKQAEALHDDSSSIKYQQKYLKLVEEQKKIVRFKLDFLQG